MFSVLCCVCMCVCVCVYRVYVCVCMYVCVSVCVYIYIYAYENQLFVVRHTNCIIYHATHIHHISYIIHHTSYIIQMSKHSGMTGAPCWVWNAIADLAYHDKMHYFYQLNDDIQFETNSTSCVCVCIRPQWMCTGCVRTILLHRFINCFVFGQKEWSDRFVNVLSSNKVHPNLGIVIRTHTRKHTHTYTHTHNTAHANANTLTHTHTTRMLYVCP